MTTCNRSAHLQYEKILCNNALNVLSPPKQQKPTSKSAATSKTRQLPHRYRSVSACMLFVHDENPAASRETAPRNARREAREVKSLAFSLLIDSNERGIDFGLW